MNKSLFRRLPAFILVISIIPLSLSASGHFEFGFHYGTWNIDVLKSLIEQGISNGLERAIKDNLWANIRKTRESLEEVAYEQDVSFDSGGNNWGFEVRFYPGGFGRTFSLGFSVERTAMWISVPELSVSLTAFDNLSGKQGTAKADASGARFGMKTLSYHLHLRWDIAPLWKVRPFITFGLGMAGGLFLEEGRLTASYSAELTIEGEETEFYDEDTVDKTLQELREDMEGEDGENNGFFLPPVLPFIQLNLGIKGEITPNLYLLVEAGVFNGFIVRGGISVRL